MRSAAFSDLEMTSIKDGFLFDGYAAVFGEKTDIGEFTEEVKHGAFRKILSTGVNVPFVHEHDPSQLLGTTKSGRVRLVEETRGLRVQANLADTDLSRRIKTLTETGDITGMSYGYVAGKENSDWEYRGSKPHRMIKGFKALLDVCTTWDPAYAATEAQFRSLALANPQAADSLQQLLTGAYPQLEEEGEEAEVPAELEDSEDATSGVGAPALAARKRRLQLLTITLEGETDEE
jgi:HK97 family phage prohead protease